MERKKIDIDQVARRMASTKQARVAQQSPTHQSADTPPKLTRYSQLIERVFRRKGSNKRD